jgi:hypothetical protein
VKLAAAKLGLGKVENWVESELNGYQDRVPEYRIINGRPIAWNPFHGWVRIGGHVEQIAKSAVGSSVAELEDLTCRSDDGGELMISYSDQVMELVRTATGGSPGDIYALRVDRSQVVGILDRVRNLVLDWSIDLEKAGVRGTEYSFEEEDKRKARDAQVNITIGTIGSFVGNLGVGNTASAITLTDVDIELVGRLARELREHAVDLDRLAFQSDRTSRASRASSRKSLVLSPTIRH